MVDIKSSHIKPLPIDNQSTGFNYKKKRSPKKLIIISTLIILAILIGAAISANMWYNNQLAPIGGDISQKKLIKIEAGSTPGQIGDLLESESIIRSSVAFDIYTRIIGKQSLLQAGIYRLSPAESTQQIVEHLVNGLVDQFSITFYPGATIIDNISPDDKKYDVTTILKKAGYSQQEISSALRADYISPLFTSKPKNADLEGYIYGQTYFNNTGASVEDVLQRTFDEFYDVVQENDFINKFAKRGLSLYQGITLASIIQREANSAKDQKQVAQVFYLRLDIGMNLGSDVTYQYIADKTGVKRDTNLDSPYNTRRYPGLPPGPIAVPGLTALEAVAAPAKGDYLFFLSGDDDVTYFAYTEAEHNQNIIKHCAIKCSTQ